MRIRIALATILLILSASSVQAMSLTWSFQDALFDDGTSLTGSFDFNAAVGGADGFSNVNVSTQSGSGLIGQTYNSVTQLSGAIGFTSMLGSQVLGVLFDEAMTNAGGIIGLDEGGEIRFTTISIFGKEIPFPSAGRFIESGGIASSAISLVEPAGLAIFGLGLILIVSLRRRASI